MYTFVSIIQFVEMTFIDVFCFGATNTAKIDSSTR